MKKIFCSLATGLALLVGSSCQEFDNYEEPQETLKGAIIDAETQQPF